MKRIILALLFICSNAFGAITDGKFGINQIFDVQYNWSGTTLNASNFIAPYNKNFQTVTVTSGQYFQFFDSTTNPGKHGLKLMNSNGTQHSIIHDYGDITALGSGAIFYLGTGWLGNVITTGAGYAYGSSASFTNMDTSVSSSDLSSYTFASSTPLSAGQTAPPPAPAAPPNLGFEAGNTTSWTISNTTGAANWGSGSGAAVVTGLSHTPGDGKTWNVTPYGTYMLSLQPGDGAPTFDAATTSLGLTAGQNSAIKNLLIQQSNAGGGGDPTPTNASWVKRDMALKAGVTYTIAWQYLSTDYTPFNDGSIITLVHKTDSSKVPTLNNAQRNYALLGFTNPGTGDYSTSSYGATGWQVATFTVPADGDYSLGFAVFNLGDTALSPILLIDEMQGTTMLNGTAFNPVPPNEGSGAPVAGGGGAVEPTWPATSDITANQLIQKNAAKARVASITLGNHLYIEQKIGSSSNTVTVEQTGNYNKIAGGGGGTYAIINGGSNTFNVKQGDTLGKNLFEFSVTGNTNNITLWQARNPTTGLQDGSESGGHYMGLNITGSTNTLSLKQSNDGGTTSGHFAYVDVTGNTNQGTLKQMGNGEKTFFGIVNGNTNVFDVTQQGSGSFMDLSLTGNGHNVTASQKDAGSHKATINLTNAGGSSTVNLIQQGSTAQNINITQQCATLSGCSVSVTQGGGP
jgi:fibronectin-binding autotransporter adhesin